MEARDPADTKTPSNHTLYVPTRTATVLLPHTVSDFLFWLDTESMFLFFFMHAMDFKKSLMILEQRDFDVMTL